MLIRQNKSKLTRTMMLDVSEISLKSDTNWTVSPLQTLSLKIEALMLEESGTFNSRDTTLTSHSISAMLSSDRCKMSNCNHTKLQQYWVDVNNLFNQMLRHTRAMSTYESMKSSIWSSLSEVWRRRSKVTSRSLVITSRTGTKPAETMFYIILLDFGLLFWNYLLTWFRLPGCV